MKQYFIQHPFVRLTLSKYDNKFNFFLLKWVQKYSSNLQFKHGKYRKVLGALKNLVKKVLKNPAPPRFFILLDFLTKNCSFSD
jgi:hypothetical protein